MAILTVKSNTRKLLKMAADELNDKIHFFRESAKVEDDAFKPDATGHSPGDTVSVRIPTQWLVQEDNFDITSTMQVAKERSVSATLDMSATVPFELTTQDLATDIDIGKVYERLVQPAILDMAANIEARLLKKATQYTSNTAGTAGSTVVDPDTVMRGGELMDECLAPQSQRFFLMDSGAMRSAVNANKSLFTFKRKEYDEAYIGNALGFDWLKSQLIYRHTNGNDVTGVAVEASVVTPAEGMTTLGVDGLTADTGTITKGTVFTIAGVYAVHPQTKQNLGYLKQFSHVGNDVTANSSGQATLTLNEPIYSSTSGSLQNVSALPADETGALVFVGSASTTYKQSLMFHKKAFRVMSVPMVMPEQAEISEQVTESGISLALIRDFDIKTRKMITRLDWLGMCLPVRPSWACRVTA